MKAYLHILLAAAAMSAEILLLKTTDGVSPAVSGMVIFGTAGGLLALGAARGERCQPFSKRDLPWALLIGLVGTGCNLLWINGTRLTSAANASALGRLDVIFTLLLSAALFRERIHRSAWPFLGLSVGGAALLSGLDGAAFPGRGMAGDGMIVGAAFLLSLNGFLIKKTAGRLGPLRLAAVNCGVNVAAFGMILLWTGDAGISSVTAGEGGWLLACGFCSFAFFYGYYHGLRVLPVWEVRLTILTVPAFTAVGGALFLGEALVPRTLAAMLLLLAGTAGLIVIKGAKGMPRGKRIRKPLKQGC